MVSKFVYDSPKDKGKNQWFEPGFSKPFWQRDT